MVGGCIVIDDVFFFQAEDGIRDLVRSRGLGDVYKRQDPSCVITGTAPSVVTAKLPLYAK